MKKVYLFVTICLFSLFLAGCFSSLTEVTSIAIASEFDYVYETGEELDLSQLMITVTKSDGSVSTVSAATSGVVVTGWNTSTGGEKTLVITYQGITIRANYFVVNTDSEDLVQNSADLKTALSAEIPKSTIFVLNKENPYVLGSDHKAAFATALTKLSTLNIVGIPNSDGDLPVIKGLDITGVPVKKTISFSNFQFEPHLPDKTENGTYHMVKASSAKPNDNTSDMPGKIRFNNCIFTTDKKSIAISSSGDIVNMEIENSQFLTTNNGYYEVVLTSSGNPRNYYEGTDFVVRNSTIRGAFKYAFGQTGYGTFENNTIEYISSTNSGYEKGKSPSGFHATPIGYYINDNNEYASHGYSIKDGKWAINEDLRNTYKLVIKNNKFINLENVIRVYSLDRYHSTNLEAHLSETFVFANNEIENCSYLVNKSTAAWATDIASYLESRIEPGKDGYVNLDRFVIQMNTGLVRKTEEELIIDYDPNDDGNLKKDYKVISGLYYQEKYTTTPDFLYKFEGSFGIEELVNGKNEMVYRYYLSKEVDGITKLYTIAISGSLDGLDKRVITEVDINSTQGAAAYTFFFGDGE